MDFDVMITQELAGCLAPLDIQSAILLLLLLSLVIHRISTTRFISAFPTLHIASFTHERHTSFYSFAPLNKRKPGWSLFQHFLRDQYCFLLDSSSSSNKDTCFHMEKVRSLIKPIQPWTTAGKKRRKRDMRSLIVFRTRTKKKRDEQENGVGDIIDQPTNKIKRRGSH
jgi:hypothetical protein